MKAIVEPFVRCRRHTGFGLLAVLFALSFAAPAVAVSAKDAALVARLDALFAKAYPADEPGAAVIVQRDGETILRKGYGMANLELEIPVEPDMVFRLGSITKQFTAVAVMMMVEEGKLRLDAPITEYLPDFPLKGKRITVENLLHHTSGIKGYTEMDTFRAVSKLDKTVGEMVAFFRDEPFEFEPGTEFRYSNSGYFLLGAILEKVSGKTYARLIEERIFRPLGMSHSYYDRPETLIPRRASGYAGGKGSYRNADYISMTLPYAAGSLASSVDDLALWDASLYGDRLLSAASRRRLWTAGVLADGRGTHYGYGWGLFRAGKHEVVWHNGGIDGFSTSAIRLPEEKVFVALLSNNPELPTDPFQLTMTAALEVVGETVESGSGPAVPAEKAGEYVGVYASTVNPEDQRIIHVEGDRLFLRGPGGKRALRAQSEDRFRIEGLPVSLRFTRTSSGVIGGLVLERPASPDFIGNKTALPVPAERQEVRIDSAVFDDYVGEYALGPGFSIRFRRDGGRYFTQATGQPELELFAESETRFFLRVVDATVEFIRGEDGKVSGMVLHQAGQHIPGKRMP